LTAATRCDIVEAVWSFTDSQGKGVMLSSES
jgi:hypothetical protein